MTAHSTTARGTPAARPTLVRIHKDYTSAPTGEIQELRFAPFPTWFPTTRDQSAQARFYTVVQEDMYMAFVHAQTQFREHKVLGLEVLGNMVGAYIRLYFTYLLGLPGLLALPGTYVEEWVKEFFASVWIAPDHSYIHYALCWHFIVSLPKIDYKSILSNGTKNVEIDIPNHHYVRKVTLGPYDSGLSNVVWY